LYAKGSFGVNENAGTHLEIMLFKKYKKLERKNFASRQIFGTIISIM